jgi:hypothetical protein
MQRLNGPHRFADCRLYGKGLNQKQAKKNTTALPIRRIMIHGEGEGFWLSKIGRED